MSKGDKDTQANISSRSWIPDEEECRALLQQAAAPKKTVVHAGLVERRALYIARRIRKRGYAIDEKVVLAGALLHDVARHSHKGLAHGVAGAQWLREKGVAEAVCLCVQRHILAGISASQAKQEQLGRFDLIPITLEEKVVAHADNLTGKETPRTLAQLLAKLKHKQLAESAIERVLQLDQELRLLAGGKL